MLEFVSTPKRQAETCASFSYFFASTVMMWWW